MLALRARCLAAHPPVVTGFVIFCLALVRLSSFVHPGAEFPQNPEAIRIAISLAETGRYADPFYVSATGPTGHMAPVFPLLASALLRLSGPHWGFALQLTAVVCVALMLSLFPLAAHRLAMDWRTGALAAGLWLLATPILYPRFEAQLAALAYLALTLAAASVLARPSLPRAIGLGALCALALLILPTGLPVVAAFLLFVAASAPRRALAAAFITAAVLFPWLIRNRLALGAWVPLRTNFGLELEVSNNDCAAFSFRANFDSGCMPQRHPNTNLREALLVRNRGEVAYNREKLASALHWIRTHPARFLFLTSRRALAFWLPNDSSDFWASFLQPGYRLHGTMNLALLPVSLAGLAMLCRKAGGPAFLLASWLVFYPPVYYIVQADDRYRFPILWVEYLLGAYALLTLWRWICAAPVASRREQVSSRRPAPDSAAAQPLRRVR